MKKIVSSILALAISSQTCFGGIKDTLSPIPYPTILNFNVAGGAPNTATDSMDTTADKVAAIFASPVTDTLTSICVPLGTIAGASGNMTVDIRIETVDTTTGFPTGTLWNTNTNVTQTWAFNDDSSWKCSDLTAGASMNQGDRFAYVANPLSFTTVTSGQITRFSDSFNGITYGATDLTGVGYAKANTVSGVLFKFSQYGYVHVEGTYPLTVVGSAAFNSGSSPAVRGFRSKVPSPMRISGVWAWMVAAGTSSDFNVKLRDSDGTTVLASGSVDANVVQSPSTAGIWKIPFTSDVIIYPNRNYYVSFEPTTANNITVYSFDAPNADAMNAMWGGKDFSIWSTFSGGTWTETATSHFLGGLLIDGLSDGNNGSWGLSH